MTAALVPAQEGVSEDADALEEQELYPAQTPFESGIPPGGRLNDRAFAVEADERAQLAVAENTRTEANLNALARGIQQLAARAAAASEANDALGRELDAVRELLAHSSAQQMVLTRRVRLLEDALECARVDAERELAGFIAQEDAFLAELLTDHASTVADLERRLRSTQQLQPGSSDEPDARPASSAELRAALASAELASAPRLAPSPAPAFVGAGESPIDSDAAPSTVREPELDLVTLAPPRSSRAPKPPLKQKPDVWTRPLIEYSLSRSDVTPEHTGPARVDTRPYALARGEQPAEAPAADAPAPPSSEPKQS